MQLTKLIITKETLSTSAGSASSISAATCVRIANTNNQSITIGISTVVGAATTIYFDIPHDTIEFLQKQPTDVIWQSSGTAITVNKVGFTN